MHTNKITSHSVKNMDCRKGMQEIADNSISVVITDPPYFIDGMNDNWNDTKLRNKIDKSHLINSMPAGMKFDINQSKNLKQFLKPIAEEWVRVTKPGAFIICFMQPRLSHAGASAMEEAGIEIRDLLVWKKRGQPKAFSQDHFVKKRKDLSEQEKKAIIKKLEGRKTPQLTPEIETIILGQTKREGTYIDNWLKWGVGLIDVSNPLVQPENFPSNLIPVLDRYEKYGHLTAKPVNLLRHLLRIFGGNAPLVLDPFAGCGSTGEACVLENCSFIGYETDKFYYRTANERIQKVKENTKSAGFKKSIQKSKVYTQEPLIFC